MRLINSDLEVPARVDRPAPIMQRGRRPSRFETANISQKIVSETVERLEVRMVPRVYTIKAQEEPNPDIDEILL